MQFPGHGKIIYAKRYSGGIVYAVQCKISIKRFGGISVWFNHSRQHFNVRYLFWLYVDIVPTDPQPWIMIYFILSETTFLDPCWCWNSGFVDLLSNWNHLRLVKFRSRLSMIADMILVQKPKRHDEPDNVTIQQVSNKMLCDVMNVLRCNRWRCPW